MSIDLLVADFVRLAGRYPNHCGIILAAQNSYLLSQLIELWDRMMTGASDDEFVGRLKWLSDWK
jgi:hypothetical protein